MNNAGENPRAITLGMYALGLSAILLFGFVALSAYFAFGPHFGIDAGKPVLIQNQTPQQGWHKEISIPSVRFDGGQTKNPHPRDDRGANN